MRLCLTSEMQHSHHVRSRHACTWHRLDSFDLQRGAIRRLGKALLTQASPYPTHLVLYWKKGERDPWFLATNMLSARPAARLHNRRMWIKKCSGT